MNFSLKPHHIIAHWVPGFLVVFASAILCFLFLGLPLGKICATGPLILFIISGVVAGQIIDAFRMVWIESARWWERCTAPVDWDFFFRTRDQRLQNLDDFYYVFYEFDVNCLIGIIIVGCVSTILAAFLIVEEGWVHFVTLVRNTPRNCWVLGGMGVLLLLVSAVTLYRDARSTRKELAKHTGSSLKTPHEGVVSRLGISKIIGAGIGVFAILDIPEGMPLFGEDDARLELIDPASLKGLDPEIQLLYDDFCIISKKGRQYLAPHNFNSMTIAWYLNHSNSPNVVAGLDSRFFAKRRIARGEELTIDYRSYNEWDEEPKYLNKDRSEAGKEAAVIKKA